MCMQAQLPVSFSSLGPMSEEASSLLGRLVQLGLHGEVNEAMQAFDSGQGNDAIMIAESNNLLGGSP